MDHVERFIQAALKASILVSPSNPGLTHQELITIGVQFEIYGGEIRDTFQRMGRSNAYRKRGDRLLPVPQFGLSSFVWSFKDDPRNWKAFEFVHKTLQDLVRKEGKDRAAIAQSVLVARGIDAGFSKHDMEVAIASMLADELLIEESGQINFMHGKERYPLPSKQMENSRDRMHPMGEWLTKVIPSVRDVVTRRSDQRPASIEPLDAFTERLNDLGYGGLKIWWELLISEMRRLDPVMNPTATTVLAAALAEASLSFVVTRAKESGASMSKGLEGSPMHWKFDKLAQSAKSGKLPILDEALFSRCSKINSMRQRIHAGRLIEDPTSLPRPDARPEEAREAKATLDILVRRILDWLDSVDQCNAEK